MLRAAILVAAICACSLIEQGEAFGKRGAAERVAAYFAYLAEGSLYNVKSDYSKLTIAPDCGLHLPGKAPDETNKDTQEVINEKRRARRCTFDQFLMYVWLKGEGQVEANRPEDVRVLTGSKRNEAFVNVNPDQLAIYVYNWGGKGALTGNIDPSRLIKGATDYYNAIPELGKPLAMLTELKASKDEELTHTNNALQEADKNDVEKIKDLRKTIKDLEKAIKPMKKILDGGKASVEMMYWLRGQNLDRYRIPTIKERLEASVTDETVKEKINALLESGGSGRDLVEKQLNDVEKPEDWPTWERMDVAKIVGELQGDIPDIENRLRDIIKNAWRVPSEAGDSPAQKLANEQREADNEAHLKAFRGTVMALVGSKCNTPPWHDSNHPARRRGFLQRHSWMVPVA